MNSEFRANKTFQWGAIAAPHLLQSTQTCTIAIPPLNSGVRDYNMSLAKISFEYEIKEAEELLAHFDAITANPPPPNAEALKRAGLVMALMA